MNIAKNMEVIFVAVLALVSVTGLATASARAPAAITATVATDGAMPVVTVSARRMSAAEKAATAR
jgi:hypothetical protein